MRLISETLSPPLITPEPNKYYTFVYTAKTPRIWYDQHPFIICTSVDSWGFTGSSFHWNDYRRYTWKEASNLFEIYEEEVPDMIKYPTARFKFS